MTDTEPEPKVNVKRYVRDPFYVDAVQVTSKNMEDVAKWCNGDIRTSAKGDPDLQTQLDPTTDKTRVPEKYIKVRVARPANDKQTMAYVGDWILYAGTGYKVYTDGAFKKSFSKVTDDNIPLHTARSAKTGEFVSNAYAEENPDTTVVETHRDVTGGGKNEWRMDRIEEAAAETAPTTEKHSHVVSKKRSDGNEELGISGEHS